MNSRKQPPRGGGIDPSAGDHDVAQLFGELGSGKQESLPLLIPQVYKEMRKLAHFFMQKEGPNHTLQTTALVHEAYLRLVDQRLANWKNRDHFFAIAAKVMRRILVDYARRKKTAKRGGQIDKISLEDEVFPIPMSPRQSTMLIALDEALSRLARMSPRQSQLIELLFFGGMTEEETAQLMKISLSTVKRDWHDARLWLNREIGGADDRKTTGADLGFVS